MFVKSINENISGAETALESILRIKGKSSLSELVVLYNFLIAVTVKEGIKEWAKRTTYFTTKEVYNKNSISAAKLRYTRQR